MIKVCDKYCIEGEPRNYTLKRECVSEKTGKEYLLTISYHQNIEDALRKIYKTETRNISVNMKQRCKRQ